MHELGICRALVTRLEEVGREQRGRILSARVAIGPLSGIEPALLAAAFPLAATGSEAEGAVLEIEEQAVRVRCRSCGRESAAAPNRLICAACGDWRTDLVSGDEIMLLRVELDQSPERSEALNV